MKAKSNIKFEITIPDSYLYDVRSEIDKTSKIFQLSRALSIFRVEKVILYHDKILDPPIREREYITTILEYLDTPQYLRRKIYPKLDILKSVGRLHPLRSPHHKDKASTRHLKSGEIRVGLLEKRNQEFFVDVGLDFSVKYEGGNTKIGNKINVKLVQQNKHLFAKDATADDLSTLLYWGYTVQFAPEIKDVMKKFDKSKVVLTSRYAKQFDAFEFIKKNSQGSNHADTILLVFGSPKFGLKPIFEAAHLDINEFESYNFFPIQGTQTIRLEEAIFGVLAILNYCTRLK